MAPWRVGQRNVKLSHVIMMEAKRRSLSFELSSLEHDTDSKDSRRCLKEARRKKSLWSVQGLLGLSPPCMRQIEETMCTYTSFELVRSSSSRSSLLVLHKAFAVVLDSFASRRLILTLPRRDKTSNRQPLKVKGKFHSGCHIY